MSYPFCANPTFNEMLQVVAKHGVSLCRLTQTVLVARDGSRRADPWYLYQVGTPPYGIAVPASGSDSLMWVAVEGIARHFDIAAAEFGLDAEWPAYG